MLVAFALGGGEVICIALYIPGFKIYIQLIKLLLKTYFYILPEVFLHLTLKIPHSHPPNKIFAASPLSSSDQKLFKKKKVKEVTVTLTFDI